MCCLAQHRLGEGWLRPLSGSSCIFSASITCRTALSTARAEQAGVADLAVFVEGDMFAADISRATVLALFLLPDNLERLRPSFLTLAPGTRIVLNTFALPGWTLDETVVLPGCGLTMRGTVADDRIDGLGFAVRRPAP